MDEAVRAWLTGQVGPIPAGKRTLILCRSRVTGALVRRWLAQGGGGLGVEIAQPSTLAAQLRRRTSLADAEVPAADDPTLPPDTELGRRIAGRPGLTAVARRWVQHARVTRAAGADLTVPARVQELLDRGFAIDQDHASLVELLESDNIGEARKDWDRIVIAGMWSEPGVSSPWEDRLASDLAGALPSPPPERDGPIDAVRVPDVGAEARLAVQQAVRDPAGTLILCAHVATARRVREALARNGIQCAWRDTEPLSSHEVASAVRRAAAWFSEGARVVGLPFGEALGDPPVQAEDLSFVLARIGVGPPHPAVAAFVDGRLAAAGLTATFVTRALLDEVIRHARLIEAPLSAWIARLAGVAAGICTEQHPGKLAVLRAAAIAVRARVLVLQAALQRRPLLRVLEDDAGVALSFDPDDFDQVIAQLLGSDALGADLPAPTTLGAVHRFLVESRLRVHDDPAAQAILGSLGRRAAWPAGPAWVHQALGGAHDPGILGDGVDVLLADDWDGRPSTTLLLLDVHDHGLARHGRPDPLLADEEIAGLATLPIGRQVERRLGQVRRAAGRAGRTLAIVTERDASGREVVPPVLLDLRFVPDDHARGSYGLDLRELPELAPLGALEVESGPPSPLPDVVRSPGRAPLRGSPWEIGHLATQATAEWVREGRGPRLSTSTTTSFRPSLAEILRADLPLAPPSVAPYLGDASGTPEAILSGDEHSVTRLLAPLSRCGYRAFASAVLRLDEEEEVKSELDAREIGNAVHAALEHASAEIAWRTMGEGGAERALAALRAATDEAFAEAAARLGAPSPAHAAAGDGLRARWNVHWESYVESRLRPVDTKGVQDKELRDHPDVIGAEALFRDRVPGGADLEWWLIRDWLLDQAGSDLDRLDDEMVRRAKDNDVPCAPDDLRAFLSQLSIQRLGQSLRQARVARLLLMGPVEQMSVATELGFGSVASDPQKVPTPDGEVEIHLPHIELQLGRGAIAVRGQIDRVEWITTKQARGAAVIDFKTGMSRYEGWKFRDELKKGLDPQLLVYAMVLERARKDGLLPEALRMPVALVAHDRVWMTRRATDERPEQPDTVMAIDLGFLRAAAATLGELVDHTREGRWWLRPQEQGCPLLNPFAFRCPAAPACRLRALRAKERAPEADDDGADGP